MPSSSSSTSSPSGGRIGPTHVTVNPFYIDTDEDDGSHDWDDDWADDHDSESHARAERTMLMMAPNDDDDDDSVNYPPDYNRRRNHRTAAAVAKFHNRAEPYDHRHRHYRAGAGSATQEQSQYWKYGLVVGIVALLIVVVTRESTGGGGGSDSPHRSSNGGGFVSLIDEIPDDEMRLVVLGERHSGVPWMESRLQECFPQAHVSSVLQRNGHFFQDDETSSRIRNHDVIVVHLVLNIYDWLEQMRLSPEYSPNHMTVLLGGSGGDGHHMIPLDWKDFVTKAWTMPRPERDLILLQNTAGGGDDAGPICQQDFRYHQVVSCVPHPLAGTDNPIYELSIDEDDEVPYESIINLRAAKLRNHQNVQRWTKVRKLITSRYDDVGKEMRGIVHEIQQATGWNVSCTGKVLPPSLDRSKDMTVEFVNYVTEYADWEAESLVSYRPWTVADIHAKEIQDDTEQSDTSSQTSKSHDTSPSGAHTSDAKDNKDSAVTASPTNKKPNEAKVDQSTRDQPKEGTKTAADHGNKNTTKPDKHGNKEHPVGGNTAANSTMPGLETTSGSDNTQQSDTSEKKAEKGQVGSVEVAKNHDDKKNTPAQKKKDDPVPKQTGEDTPTESPSSSKGTKQSGTSGNTGNADGGDEQTSKNQNEGRPKEDAKNKSTPENKPTAEKEVKPKDKHNPGNPVDSKNESIDKAGETMKHDSKNDTQTKAKSQGDNSDVSKDVEDKKAHAKKEDGQGTETKTKPVKESPGGGRGVTETERKGIEPKGEKRGT